jgi:putative transposase
VASRERLGSRNIKIFNSTMEAVECATRTWGDWFNTRRRLEPIGDVQPAEFEAPYYAQAAVA